MNNTLFTLWLPGLLGLMVGSFLNVVIHRLPRMLQAQWDAQSHSDTQTDPTTQPPARVYNLAWPGSHCPDCAHPLSWYDNIPVLSYLMLRARCRHCQAAIHWRYPFVELTTSALFTWAFMHHGWGAQALVWASFAAALLALACIDADTTLLPDAITQPLIWSGLLASSLQLTGLPLAQSLWGATAGYLFLWTVYWLFKIVTGKEGMGYGDFKLLAALGAWLGWPALLSLVLIASLTGVLGGLWLRLRQQLPEGGYIPFGPFLVLAGLWVMILGPLPWFQI